MLRRVGPSTLIPYRRGVWIRSAGTLKRPIGIRTGDVTVWHCGQMFDWPGDRMPTVREHRFMTYSAVVSGLQGDVMVYMALERENG